MRALAISPLHPSCYFRVSGITISREITISLQRLMFYTEHMVLLVGIKICLTLLFALTQCSFILQPTGWHTHRLKKSL
jgi:hypothetical protein